jgi:hypothetical protein
VAQERADAVAIVFAKPPPVRITPMKNQMNVIWAPIKANGVNYYMFAKPRTWFKRYSERTNPISPYYQAWVGGYVIEARDGYGSRLTPIPFDDVASSLSAILLDDAYYNFMLAGRRKGGGLTWRQVGCHPVTCKRVPA